MDEKLTAKDITEYHVKELPTVPQIGMKCFEPNKFSEEAVEIQNHLQAIKELLSYKKIQKFGSLSQAIWHPDIQKAEVINQIGSCWTSMGHSTDNKLYLHPEEALYLLEMGFLELKYNDVPMSIQRAYSALLKPATHVPEENFRVFSKLMTDGYKVLRHNSSNTLTKYEKQLHIHKVGIKIHDNVSVKRTNTLNNKVEDVEFKKIKLESLTNLFPVNVNDDDHLEQLKIFKPYVNSVESTLSVQYDVYSSSDSKGSFKKTCLQLPQVRIVVHRGDDPMPDMKEIYHLAQQYEDEVPIVHAVVFPEYVSFYSITPVSTPTCS